MNGEKKAIELDVVAESIDKKRILIGECKWTQGENAAQLLHDLKTKTQSLPFVKNKKVFFALFLKQPALDGMTDCVFLPQDVVDDFKKTPHS